MRFLMAVVLLGSILVLPAQAQTSDTRSSRINFATDRDNPPLPVEHSLHYVIKHGATVYTAPDDGRAYIHLQFREPVYVQETKDGWSQIRTQDGARGYVDTAALSNMWIRVSKRQKMVFLYRGTELLFKFPADFGYNAFADKERRGSTTNPDDWRTPNGTFFVSRKNPHSKFYKAFLLNYPTGEDAERGLNQGLISKQQHDAIVQAEKRFKTPPMNTALGGYIEIHGDGTGASSNWTQGCVAVHNTHMDKLWNLVSVGTPVLIEP